MPSQLLPQRQPATKPQWLLPLVVFVSIPSAVLVVGLMVLLVIWLVAGGHRGPVESRQAVAQQPAVASAAPTQPAATSSAATQPAPTSPTASVPPVAPSGPADTPAPPSVAAAAGTAPTDEPPTAGATPTDSVPRVLQILQLPYLKDPKYRFVISRAEDYAYDPRRGRLAIYGPWQRDIGFIAVDDQRRAGPIQDVTRVEVQGLPTALIFQSLGERGVFIVAHRDPPGFAMIDPETLQVVKELPLASGAPFFFRASGESAASFVYFTADFPPMSFAAEDDPAVFRSMARASGFTIQRIDVTRMALDPAWRPSELQASGIARNGREVIYWYPWRRSVFVEPGGRVAATDDALLSLDLGRQVMKLDFRVRGFLPRCPWLVGTVEKELVVGSMNDGRIVTQIPFPDYVQEAKRIVGAHYHQNHLRAQVFTDVPRNRLVVGLVQHVMVIPIETLGLPEEPDLLLAESPPDKASAGQAYQFALKTGSDNSTATLVKGPEGMTIQDGVLRWVPQAAGPKPVEVRIRLTAGNTSREEAWKVTVE